MRQSIIINILPVSPDKSRNQKKQRALRLMKIGHKDIYNPELITRNDYDSCA